MLSTLHKGMSLMHETRAIHGESLDTILTKMYQLYTRVGRMSCKAFMIKELIHSDVENNEPVENPPVDSDDDEEEDDLPSDDPDTNDSDAWPLVTHDDKKGKKI